MAIGDIDIRRITFTVFFVSFWLIVWYIAAYFNDLIHNKQSNSQQHKSLYNWFLFFFNFVFGISAAFLANIIYRFGDLYFFNSYDAWEDVPLSNPELTLSLFSIYMIIFTTDIFFSSMMKRKEDQLKMEELKRESTLAQYLVLKSQIEPHFLFNSLSVLSSIIHTDLNLADEFILRLSKTLRYVIEKNELTLVPLKDEIQFAEDYFFLIKNRFEEGIVFEITIDKETIQDICVPPASLQLLIENAVKHNRFTVKKPLKIHMYIENNQLCVKNNLNQRDDMNDSTKQGLRNLIKRYSYFSDEKVKIVKSDSDFRVNMPILTKTEYERFNL